MKMLLLGRSVVPLVVGLWTIAFAFPQAFGQLPAFPGADGAGAYASGGRDKGSGQIVYHVTTLASAIDDPNAAADIPGTLRYGLNNYYFPTGVPRTIVFDVGGVFNLGRLPQAGWEPNGNGWDAQSRLTIGGTNVTLAGQTAPGAGVIFMGGGLKPQGDNNIIRNITVASGYGMRNWWKPGDPFPDEPDPLPSSPGPGIFPDATVYDAMDISGNNLMIDHVSTLYATDETISMNEQTHNITVQYSNISQSQNYPQWDAEGGGFTGHALGSLLEAGNNTNISFHHNLYAHHKSRVPQTQGSSAYYDFRNNVFYNWMGTAGVRRDSTRINLVGNFYLSGDGGDQPIGGNNTGLTYQDGGTSVLSGSSYVYREGNLLDTNKDGDADDGSLVSGGAYNPLWAGGVDTYAGTTDAADDAYERVLDYVGANWWTRDAVIDTPDERIIDETRNGNGQIVAWADDPWDNDPTEGQEWRNLLNTPQANRVANWDTEPDTAGYGYGVGDGMPTLWEVQHGLDPNARDDDGDFDSDGYTNLEEYLNDVAAWPAPNAILFNNSGSDSRFANILNWDANPDAGSVHPWQPSRYDEVHIESGIVFVDAVGQHAGTLVIAPESGDSAQVVVADGWLRAQQQVVVGGDPAAQGTLTLTGGRLLTPLLSKGASGSVAMNGGELSAEVLDFDVQNNGTTIAPATIGTFNVENGVITTESEIGTTHILGSLDMQAGVLDFDIGGTLSGAFDRILVDNQLTAGGTLRVSLAGSFLPANGDSFDLLDFTSATGAFTFDLPSLTTGLAWDTSSLLTTGVLSVGIPENADFDGDGDVDGADFLVWQQGYLLTGQSDNSNGDANGDGTVNQDDLTIWQAHFGETSSAAPAVTEVPEPGAISLLAFAFFAVGTLGRPNRRD